MLGGGIECRSGITYNRLSMNMNIEFDPNKHEKVEGGFVKKEATLKW